MPERRLNTMRDLRRYLAHLINRTERGEMEASVTKTLTYVSATLMRAIEGSDLEKRIDELEKRIK